MALGFAAAPSNPDGRGTWREGGTRDNSLLQVWHSNQSHLMAHFGSAVVWLRAPSWAAPVGGLRKETAQPWRERCCPSCAVALPSRLLLEQGVTPSNTGRRRALGGHCLGPRGVDLVALLVILRAEASQTFLYLKYVCLIFNTLFFYPFLTMKIVFSEGIFHLRV